MIFDETIVDPDFKTTKSSKAAPSTVSETMFPAVDPVERLIAVKVNENEFSNANNAFPESVFTTNLKIPACFLKLSTVPVMFVSELIVQGCCSTSSIKTKQDDEVNPLPTTS